MLNRETKFILDKNGKAVPEPDAIKWGKWLEKSQRHVELTIVGKARISTVFLAVDYNFLGKGKPVLWETMVFGGKHNEYQERYTSRADALKGHKKVVAMVKKNK